MPEISIQDALNRLKTGEARLDAIEKQISLFVGLLNNVEAAKATLENLPKEEKRAMMPTAGAVYIPSKVSGFEKVLVEVGAGIAVEKDVKAALVVMDSRLDQINSNINSLQRAAGEMNVEIQVLRRKISEYVKKQQSGQVP